jgi:DNA polymerase
MDIITLDWETAYSQEYSLTKLTTQQYVDDPRFEVIGVGIKVNDERTVSYTGHDIEDGVLRNYDFENSALLAHNALFDATILTWKFGIKPKLILDTLAMARAIHGTEVGGSLAVLARRYGIGEKGTEVLDAKGKWLKDFSTAELDAYMAYCRNDVDLTYKLFKLLTPKFNKTEIKLIDMTCRMHSEPQLQLELLTLQDHLHTVKQKKIELLNKSGVTREDIMSADRFAELLTNMGIKPPTKISPRTGNPIYAFAKTDEAMKELQEHPNLLIQALVAARLGVKSTIEESRTERFIAIAEAGGALPVPLRYYGAMTGRWAATDKINLQNIPRSSRLKEAIRAVDGYKIIGADLSNIELRVGLYFANQMDKLRILADGKDLYKDFASGVFGVPYDEVNKEQRFIGKTSQLSLIYGTGPNKLRNAIKQSGTDIGEEEAKRIVGLYRQSYADVRRAWYEGQHVLTAIRDEKYMEFGDTIPLPVHGSRGILLPSGLYLRYPDLLEEINEDGKPEWTYKVRKDRSRIHGPKVFQNCIQALARCVMGEAMVRINKRYPIALTVHDSCYCVVAEEEAEEAYAYMLEQLRIPPEWAPRLPLDAEGGIGVSLKEAG